MTVTGRFHTAVLSIQNVYKYTWQGLNAGGRD